MTKEQEIKQQAQNICKRMMVNYLSHEYYVHSHNKYKHLVIAVEDGSGRYEVDIDLLNAVDEKVNGAARVYIGS